MSRTPTNHEPAGMPCWIDLAARDAGTAQRFYQALFGWTPHVVEVNDGTFVRLDHGAQAVGSLYQMDAHQLQSGAPSHWLPYVRVKDLDATVAAAVSLGGQALVQPFNAGIARV